MSKSKILFILSGSISAYKACTVISRLAQDGHTVQCVMSANASKFIGASTLEGLTGQPVLSDTFEPGRQMDHIHLMNWCDLIVVCPATAHLINQFAAGLATDLPTNLFLAFDFKKPFLIFPAMNTKMWQHPFTQSSVQRLRETGLRVYDPQPGPLACGETGTGRLWEPDAILTEIQGAIAPSRQVRALITSGGTQEPIDPVRSITNLSTGQTGALIAEALLRAGHRVDWLRARGSADISLAVPQGGLKRVPFTSSAELLDQMRNLLQENRYDLVIHAAAVSDYAVEHISSDGKALNRERGTKLSSHYDQIEIRLKKTPKVIHEVGSLVPPATQFFAFKLTSGATNAEAQAAVSELFQLPHVAWVVQNDEKQFSAQEHEFHIYRRNQARPVASVTGKAALAKWIEHQIINSLKSVPVRLSENREIEI